MNRSGSGRPCRCHRSSWPEQKSFVGFATQIRSGLALVVEDLGIRQPTEVIDGVVQEPVAA
jgi:hypothetical protein